MIIESDNESYVMIVYIDLYVQGHVMYLLQELSRLQIISIGRYIAQTDFYLDTYHQRKLVISFITMNKIFSLFTLSCHYFWMVMSTCYAKTTSITRCVTCDDVLPRVIILKLLKIVFCGMQLMFNEV